MHKLDLQMENLDGKKCSLRNAITTDCEFIFTGYDVNFSRPNYVDGDLRNNIDFITDGLSIARHNSEGIFNSEFEYSYNDRNWKGPCDTLWAVEGFNGNPTDDTFGSINHQNLFFSTWVLATNWSPPSYVGRRAVVKILSKNIIFEIRFSYWKNGGGGGFAYSRSDMSALPIYRSSIERTIPDNWVRFSVPDNHSPAAFFVDNITDNLHLAVSGRMDVSRYPYGWFYNAAYEMDFNGQDISPERTSWAFYDFNGNYNIENFALNDNLYNLNFASLFDATEGNYLCEMIGVLGMCFIWDDRKVFLFKITGWELGLKRNNDGLDGLPSERFCLHGYEYIRSELFSADIFD